MSRRSSSPDSDSDSSGKGHGGLQVSMFENASDFSIKGVKVNNVRGNFTDRRKYNTVNDYSTTSTKTYNQQGSKGPIFNEKIHGGINTHSGGSVRHEGKKPKSRTLSNGLEFGRSHKQMGSQNVTYNQENAEGPIYNHEIEGGVNEYKDTDVIYAEDDQDPDWEEDKPPPPRDARRKSRHRHAEGGGYRGDHGYGQRGPHRGSSYRSHGSSYVDYGGQSYGADPYNGHGSQFYPFHPPGGSQYFSAPMSVDPDGYSAEYAPSGYNHGSHPPPSTVGPSVSQRGSPTPSRRAGTAPSHHSTSPPPTMRTVPPSSLGPRSPPASGYFGLAPTHKGSFQSPPLGREGSRGLNPRHAYPSPAPSQNEEPYEESDTEMSSNKVENWPSSTSSVTNQMANMNLNGSADGFPPPPTQYPLTPPSDLTSPYDHFPESNPFKRLARRDWEAKRSRTLS